MRPDIAIIGGGAIGCAIAYDLACAGAGEIVVIESGGPGGVASRAAAGVLAVASSRARGGALFGLRRASLAMFADLRDKLLEQSGIDIEYRRGGLLKLAFTDAEAAELQRLTAEREEQGFAADWLDPKSVRSVEAAVSTEVRGAAHFADDGAVNNARLVQALQLGAERLGVVFRYSLPVEGVETSEGRVVALLASKERLTPGLVVVAAGAWSAEIGGLLGAKIPVRPDKGEMLALRGACNLLNTVSWNDGYLAPRRDGEILVGSTSTRGVFDTTVTPESVNLLLERAIHMVPTLRNAETVRTWAGLRPIPTIRRPIIGPLRGYENVILATGHHRSGILLAPITGKLVAELITKGVTSISLQPFCYRPR